jgi:purine-cytosine permease-like protein
MVNPSGAWLGASLVIGILMAWFGILIIIISLPLARGEVRGRDYNYRPWKPFVVSADLSDRINRQGAKLAIACSVLFIIGGLLVIALRRMGAGEWTLYAFLLFIVLWLVLLAGVYIYAWLAAQREQRSA